MTTDNFGAEITNKIVRKYDRHGKITNNEDDLVYAQYTETVYYDGRKEKNFAVLTFNGLIFDPLGTDGHRASRLMLKLTPTNSETLEYYVKYLNNNNKVHMTRANRSFINV